MRRSLRSLAVAALLAAPSTAAGQVEYQDAFLELRYRGHVDTLISAIYDGSEFLLPMGELFRQLQLDYAFQPDAARASGYFISPDMRWTLRFDPPQLLFDGAPVELEPGDIIARELDVYITPALLERAFGLEAEVSLSDLRVQIHSERDLPIDEAARRELARLHAGNIADPVDAPLRYPRRQDAIGGYVLGYGVNLIGAEDARSVGVELSGGAELLGGGLQARLDASAGDNGVDLADTDVLWRYVFDGPAAERPEWAPTEVRLGSVVSGGLQPYTLDGAQVSSAPIRLRRSIGTHVVAGTTEPEWEVELYLQDRLIGFQRADSLGRFRFELPLTYGSTLLTLRYYGPEGAIREEQRRLEVPAVFLPAGELDWLATAGRLEREGETVLQAEVAYGATRTLTSAVGADYLGDSLSTGVVPYNRTALRIARSHVLTATAAPGAYYDLAADLAFESNALFSVQARAYDGSGSYNPLGLERSYSLHAFQPMRVLDRRMSVRASLGQMDFRDGTRRRNIDTDVFLTLGRLRPNVGYSLARRSAGGFDAIDHEELNAGVLYYVGRLPGRAGRWLAGTLLRTELIHDLRDDDLRSLELSASRQISRTMRLEVGARSDFGLGADFITLRLMVDNPFMRSSTSLRHDDFGPSVVQRLGGAIAWDGGTNAPVFSRMNWVGQAGALIRMFVDSDGDRVYDAGEPLVESGRIRFADPVVTLPSDPGIVRATDLIPYYRYSARVDVASVENPLWIPVWESFSFVTDPNRFKTIDVPFYVGGVVEGRVTRVDGRPVGGLHVRMRPMHEGASAGAVQASTFTDGSFYEMGVPPGRYRVTLDPEQLELLGVRTQPEHRIVEVRETSHGDFIEGIDFTLVDQ